MKQLEKLFDFYLNSSIHVALSVFALIKITRLYFNLLDEKTVDYFIFFSTITGYNFVKYAGIAKLHHQSLTNNLKIIQFFSFLCFLLTLFFGYQLSLKTLLFFVPFGLLTLFYAVPLGGYAKNLRNIPSIKIVVIAIVWAGTTVVLPIIDAGLSLDYKELLAFIQRLLFVIVLTLPFDIRDFRFDNKHLQTIPQLIGVERSKKLGFILLAITLVIEFFITPNTDFKSAFLIVFVLLLVLLQRASIRQKKYYASFWVEAIPIFWFILLLIFNKSAI